MEWRSSSGKRNIPGTEFNGADDVLTKDVGGAMAACG